MAIDTQTALGNNGAPFKFEWRGKKFIVSYRVQKYKAALERWAKQHAIQELLKSKEYLPEADYNSALDRLIERFNLGEYSFEGEKLSKLRETHEGKIAHIRAILGPEADSLPDDEFMELFLEKGDEITAYMRACDAKITHIKRELGWDEIADPNGETLDPKALIPALKKAGWWE